MPLFKTATIIITLILRENTINFLQTLNTLLYTIYAYSREENKRLSLCIWTSYLKQLIKLGKLQISISSGLEPDFS